MRKPQAGILSVQGSAPELSVQLRQSRDATYRMIQKDVQGKRKWRSILCQRGQVFFSRPVCWEPRCTQGGGGRGSIGSLYSWGSDGLPRLSGCPDPSHNLGLSARFKSRGGYRYRRCRHMIKHTGGEDRTLHCPADQKNFERPIAFSSELCYVGGVLLEARQAVGQIR